MAMISKSTHIAVDVIERNTRSILHVVKVEITHPEVLIEALDIDLQALLLGREAYFLEKPNDDVWLRSKTSLEVDHARFVYLLRSCHPLDDLPYEVHTGRELRLMLEGIKPLAVFCDAYSPTINPWIFPEDVFDAHVASGLIVMRDFVEFSATPLPNPYKGIRRLLYALREEEWRIDAYLDLWRTAEQIGWSEELERHEGSLLGYKDWQTDAFLKLRASWPVAEA